MLGTAPVSVVAQGGEGQRLHVVDKKHRKGHDDLWQTQQLEHNRLRGDKHMQRACEHMGLRLRA